MTSTTTRQRPGRIAATVLTIVAAATLGLVGCGSASSDGEAAASATTTTVLTLTDGWAKAVEDVTMPSSTPSMSTGPAPTGSMPGAPGMDGAMTAIFGTLTNTTGSTLTVTGGSAAAAGAVQLHETAKNADGQMQMQQRQGGFVIPAGATFVLQPGGNHIMLMGLTAPLKSGTMVTVTLDTSAGPVTLTVPVRTFAGANESYQPSPSSS